MDSSVRKLLADVKDVKFTASVRPDRFNIEKRMVHTDGSIDEVGEKKAIYNDRTKELFVYHYDTQKGVGIKYNLSNGFIPCTDKI